MHVSVIKITPQKAREWLDTTNTHNRKVSDVHVKKLAKSMREGKWVANGQSISFSADGTLLDGQHRLSAIVASGVSITCPVAYGIEDDRAWSTYDVDTRKRNATQLAQMLGVQKHLPLIVAAARLMYAYDKCLTSSEFLWKVKNTASHYDAEDIAVYAAENEDLIRLIMAEVGMELTKSSGYPGGVVGMFAILWRLDWSATSEFLQKLAHGYSAGLTCPIFHMRTALIRGISGTAKRDAIARSILLALIIKAWNAHKMDNSISVLKHNISHAFPVPIGSKW